MNVKNKVDLQNGSALLLALFLLVATSMMVGTYLYLVGTESKIAQRSLDWNAAIPAAEAGVEEALTALYYYNGTNSITSNYWTQGGDGLYRKSRTLPDGSKYCTAILLSSMNPIIWSTGYVAAPFGTNDYIRRLVKVTAMKPVANPDGPHSKGPINMTGGSIIDSYDSALGPYGTNNHGSQVVVSSNAKTTGAISMSGGSTHIYGVAATGAGGTVSATGGASVVGSTRNDAAIQIDDIVPPVLSSPSSTLPAGKVNGTNYNFVAGTGNYQVSTLNIGSGKMVVNGDAVIYITYTGNNAFVISGSGSLYITPGSSLTLYSAGQMVISGGGIANGNKDASKLLVNGLPTCTQITYSGSADFYGILNAPEAAFTLSSSTAASYGTFTVNTATIQGGGGMHYDVNLGGSHFFVVQSWNELPAN